MTIIASGDQEAEKVMKGLGSLIGTNGKMSRGESYGGFRSLTERVNDEKGRVWDIVLSRDFATAYLAILIDGVVVEDKTFKHRWVMKDGQKVKMEIPAYGIGIEGEKMIKGILRKNLTSTIREKVITSRIIEALINKKAPKGMLSVQLESVSDPDRDEEGDKEIASRWEVVRTMVEAVKIVRGFITQNDLGMGNWIGGKVTDDEGKIVGEISFNGRVWEPGKVSRSEIDISKFDNKSKNGSSKEIKTGDRVKNNKTGISGKVMNIEMSRGDGSKSYGVKLDNGGYTVFTQSNTIKI